MHKQADRHACPSVCRIVIVAIIALIAAVSTNVIAQTPQRHVVLVMVNNQHASWPDCTLNERLNGELSRRDDLTRITKNVIGDLARESDGGIDENLVLAECQKRKIDYLLWCDVTHEEIRLVKSGALPMLISRRRAVAILDINYRIIDCRLGTIFKSGIISLSSKGPASIQLLEESDADPTLCLTYSDKRILFENLEAEAAAQLLAELNHLPGNP